MAVREIEGERICRHRFRFLNGAHSRLCPAFHAAVWWQGAGRAGTEERVSARRHGLGRITLHVCVWGGGHLARLAAVGRGLALGALQDRRRQRLAARGVAALEGHSAPEPRALAVSPRHQAELSRG